MTVTSDTSTALRARARKGRPGRELAVDGFFGPLADRLALALLPLRVPPPLVVLASASAGVAAAVLIVSRELVLAAALLQLKTLFDNADGRLARMSGRVTLFGRYLDSEADLAVNVVLFAALGAVTGRPWLALGAFAAVTVVLSANFNLREAFREVRGESPLLLRRTGGRLERGAEVLYGLVYAPQDRLFRSLDDRRLERLLRGAPSADRRQLTRVYHDRFTASVLANLGLSTHLAVLGGFLLLGSPQPYLWLALATLAVLPVLQVRREWVVRRRLRGAP